jgi:ABC-type proline/glycine betaine transport system permease subunit
MSKKSSEQIWNNMKHQSYRVLTHLDPSRWPSWVSFNRLKYSRYVTTTLLLCILLLSNNTIWFNLLILAIYSLSLFITMVLSVAIGVVAERTRTISEKEDGSKEFLTQLMKVTEDYPKA